MRYVWTQRLLLKPVFDLPLQDYDISGCSDGTYGEQRYFSCEGNRALFLPSSKCSPDSRLGCYDKPAAASPGWSRRLKFDLNSMFIHKVYLNSIQ